MDQSDRSPRHSYLSDRLIHLLVAHCLFPANDEEEILNKLQGLVTNIKWSPAAVVDLFKALLKRFQSMSSSRTDLPSWMMEMLHCIEIHYITSSWKSKTGKTLMELVQDKTVTDEHLKQCLADDTEKTLEEILEEIRQEKLNQINEQLLDDVRDIVSSVDKKRPIQNDGSERSELKRVLEKLCTAAIKTAKFKPRLTQMVSWCLMALSKTGRLIQVGTGEGKSCIVAMFAAFRAMRGETVDIMSSSSVLAERDLDEWRHFYKYLNISVDCNTNKFDENFKKYYKCQVVYGTVDKFAGDWLRQHFERMYIFGQRKFQCAIVDEVDSLMLDKGHHVVYLSSDMPALQHLNPLLAFIWATANQFTKIGTNTLGQKYPFHQVVLENIKNKHVDEFTVLQIAEDTGLLAKGSVNDLRRNPELLTEKSTRVTVDQLAVFFEVVERRFPSCQFSLHCINNNGELEEVNKRPQRRNGNEGKQTVSLVLVKGGFCKYMYSDSNSLLEAAEAQIKRALHFTPCELSHAKSRCYVPGFLSDLVNSKLKVWIENAFYAQTMTNDHEYIIETHGIVPVDFSCTGVIENYMKWTDGLQQFLEMKHESKLSDMTAITNYMSNVGLLQKYGHQIYGLSGTLGQQAETETLQKIYKGIKTCQIPSFKRRKLFEVEGLVLDDEKEWTEKICDVVAAQIKPTRYRGQRAVLVICETIKRAKLLHCALGDKAPYKKLYINNNMDNSAVTDQTLDSAVVIIATNLAGRGTDLKVSESVKSAGGLFVVQTFLPKNARVEAQAFGRTARQGSPGSAQLIVCSSHLPEPLQLLVLMKNRQSLLETLTDFSPLHRVQFVMLLRLFQKGHIDVKTEEMSLSLSHIFIENSEPAIKVIKEFRDDSVAEQLCNYLECDIPNIKKKEELFSQYLNVLDDVYKSSNNKQTASLLNEFWGMWLLTKFKEKDSIEELKTRLNGDLHEARKKLRQRESPSSNLYHYITFGNELRQNGNLAESIKMYSKAIEKDKCWAAIAYYNRAFASLTQQNSHQDPACLNRALEDLQNALRSVELYCEQLEVTHRYSTQTNDSNTRLEKHITARRIVLMSFKMNISEAIKKVDRARDIGGNVKLQESHVYFLVTLVRLKPWIVLLVESLRVIWSRDPLKIYQLASHSSFDIHTELKCLESLGLTHIYTVDALFSLGGFLTKIGRIVSRPIMTWKMFTMYAKRSSNR